MTGRLRRAWVNEHAHVVAWFVLASLLLGGYLGAHVGLRTRYVHSPPVEASIAASIALVQVTEDPETGRLELWLDGEPLDPRRATAGALGIDRSPAARGLVAEAGARLATYDRRLEAALRDLLASFQPVEGRPGWMEAPLQRFAGRGFEAEEGQVVQVHTGALRPLVDLEPTESGARRLLRLLAHAEVRDLRVAESASGASGATEGLVAGDVLPDVRESLQQIRRETSRRRIRLGTRRLSRPKPAEIVAAVCDELSELRAPIEDFFGESLGGVPGCAPLAPGNGGGSDPFHARLASVLLAEVGFFWTSEPLLWLEVLWLTWLGVLTECLTRLGVRYAGVDPDRRRWDPRETGRTLLKLVTAPSIAIVVVWTLMMMGWIATGPRLAQTRVAAFVPIAFALGLFPSLGFTLLDRLARAVFHETSIARPPARRSRVIRTEQGTPPIERGAPPDFGVVRERIERHATAPLRDGEGPLR